MLAGRSSSAASSCSGVRTSRCSARPAASLPDCRTQTRQRQRAPTSMPHASRPAPLATAPPPRAATGSTTTPARTARPSIVEFSSPSSYGVFPAARTAPAERHIRAPRFCAAPRALAQTHLDSDLAAPPFRSSGAPSRAVTCTSTRCLRHRRRRIEYMAAPRDEIGIVRAPHQSPRRIRFELDRAVSKSQFEPRRPAAPIS